MQTFSFKGRDFLKNGEPYTILSGAMHYFRIPREYWADRLQKLKECGFNTVETYTCWNLHEKTEGNFDFSGMLDIAAYIRMAGDMGLNVILRPGPYICAEWDFGGLPAWLQRYHDMDIRCYDEAYLSKVRRYYHALFDQVRELLCTRGGPVIMLQIENEYGSFGDDTEYLRAVVDIYRECGADCQLFTSDGARSSRLTGGTLPEFPCVANFGSHPAENFAELERFRPNQPAMCGEYWCGWFDHWYEEHHTREPEELAKLFDDMLEYGASLNFYMFHGGTNFGFMNGANFFDTYLATITSYDYCALLSEAGDLTPAYHAVRRVIEKRTGVKLPPLTVTDSPKAAYGDVVLNERCNLLSDATILGTPIHSAAPKYMEDIGQSYGFTLYSTKIHGPRESNPLIIDILRDRVTVYINGEFKGIQERDRRMDEITLSLESGEEATVDILCENMGRVNYGEHLTEQKGLRGIRFGQQYHFGWDMTPMPMDNSELLTFVPGEGEIPAGTFLRGTLSISGTPNDTFVRLDGFHHGFVVVNGINLGRYYNDAGPQKTLYVPAPFLREGANEIIVFETDGAASPVITFTDTPELG